MFLDPLFWLTILAGGAAARAWWHALIVGVAYAGMRAALALAGAGWFNAWVLGACFVGAVIGATVFRWILMRARRPA